jgi:DNA modification methylase
MIRKEVIIGDCRLILGDCLEVMPMLGRVDAVVTDPPYGIGAAAKSFMGTKKRCNSKCAPKDYGDKNWDASPADMSWLKSDIPAIVWGGNFLALPQSRRWLIWDKINDGMALADCEIAWTNTDGAIRLFRHEWSGFRRGAEQGISRQHPTQKPVALMKWCLGFLPDAQTILDPFMGSGTTLVACAKLGRKGIGIELDSGYFDVACRRVEEAYAQPDLFIAPPEKPVQEVLL